MTPSDESFLQWITFDADAFYESLESSPEWAEFASREEIRKVWNYGDHYLGVDKRTMDAAAQNYFRAAFSMGFVFGAKAHSQGWPAEVLDDPGPAGLLD